MQSWRIYLSHPRKSGLHRRRPIWHAVGLNSEENKSQINTSTENHGCRAIWKKNHTNPYVGTSAQSRGQTSLGRVWSLSFSIWAVAGFKIYPISDLGWALTTQDKACGLIHPGPSIRNPNSLVLIFPQVTESLKKSWADWLDSAEAFLLLDLCFVFQVNWIDLVC